MKDFLGRELAVGDYVVIDGPQYGTFALGTIVKMFDDRVSVYHYNDWNNDPPQWKTMLREGRQTVKVEGPDVTLKMLTIG